MPCESVQTDLLGEDDLARKGCFVLAFAGLRMPGLNKKSPQVHELEGFGFLSVPLAEREGFEPPEPLSSTVFKTAAIDHSAIFPGTKIVPIFGICKKNIASEPLCYIESVEMADKNASE